jgi:hypothetical protein
MHPRALTGRAVDVELAAECLDSVGKSPQAAAFTDVCSTDAIVGDVDHHATVLGRNVDVGLRRACVLRHVGQRLGDDVVRRGLDRRRRVVRQSRRDRYRDGSPPGQRSKRDGKSPVGQDGRV